MAMKKTICSVLVAASCFALATPAFADDDIKARAAKRVDRVFSKLDTDRDGRISRAEAAKGPKLSKTFDRVDADHDGFVTRAELNAAVERRMQRQQAKQQAQPQPAPAR
jgi:Ca2+-binding EF-hand superfamily protein